MTVGSRFSDFVFKTVEDSPLCYRSRTRTLSISTVPSSSLINCSFLLLFFSLPTLPYSSGASRTLAGRYRLGVSPFRRYTLDKYARAPEAITSCGLSHAVLRSFNAVLSRGWAHKDCHASSLTAHAVSRAAGVSADSHNPRLRCRRAAGGSSASTASVMVRCGE